MSVHASTDRARAATTDATAHRKLGAVVLLVAGRAGEELPA
jgi:hypothetical protein